MLRGLLPANLTAYFLVHLSCLAISCFLFFFFNDTATTEIYTLSLHDALPICSPSPAPSFSAYCAPVRWSPARLTRSEEHTSELQSRGHLVCRLLLEKKKKQNKLKHNNGLTSTIARLQMVEKGSFGYIAPGMQC